MAKSRNYKTKKLPKWEDYEAALEAYKIRSRQLCEQRAKYEELNGLLSAFLYQLIGERGECVFEKSKLAAAVGKYHSEVIPEGECYRVKLYDRANFSDEKVKENIQITEADLYTPEEEDESFQEGQE